MFHSNEDRPEVWAGAECTINRVGDRYFDQMALTGHDARLDDLDRIAALGIKTVRFPILWERHATDPIDWTWSDARLDRLKDLGIRPIIGLVHHGSGPLHTSLTDPSFALGLAEFASRVAARYPWVDAYTPVNEPLTTARFSGLYGHWYPHGRDNATFARCLISQCRAVVLSMRAIRKTNPGALLVQTEDFGQTHSSRALRYQADFENERRWFTWDYLCGRVDRHHPLWGYFKHCGVSDKEMNWFVDSPCPPDILGLNYYVTSERYLDGRLECYPSTMHGGNGEHRYVDTEAVRVLPAGNVGLFRLLGQVWTRYSIPIAVTEAHIACTPDEQARWLWEVWRSACQQRAAGVDVRAITAWSVFGAFDWDSLVTRSHGHYEPGAFDVRFDPPQATAVADLIRGLAAGIKPRNPILATPGWWRRTERLTGPTLGRIRRRLSVLDHAQ